MPHPSTQGRRSTPRRWPNQGRGPAAALALPILLLACVALSACGSSTSTSTTSANAAARSTSSQSTAPAPATGTSTTAAGASAPSGTSTNPAGPGAGRFAAVRECLRKNGITPKGRAGGLLGAGGAPALPKGMTRAQYAEVLNKCGANLRGPGTFKPRRTLNSSRFRTALANFAACLRQNGVKLPAPNTTGKGPIFDTKGINTASPQFKAAEAKCRAVLLAGLRPKTAAPGAGAAGGGAG